MSDSHAPTISVIIPNYNHAQYLQKRIDTVLAQTLHDFELILLDDCSTDDSQTILREYASHPRVSHLAINETNSGSTFKQWKRGMRLARGDYIWIAESDDYADERFLAQLTCVLDRDPEMAFAFCRSWHVLGKDGNICGFAEFGTRGHNVRWKQDLCLDGRELCAEYFVGNNPVPNASAVLFRRVYYERVGGVDENMRTSGDWKLWAAMAVTGKVGYVSEPFNYYRSHERTVRSAIWAGRRSLAVVYVKERLQVASWVANIVQSREAVLERARVTHAIYWVPLMLNPRIPLQLKREIAALVRKCDPRPFRRFMRLAPVALLSIAWNKTLWAFRNALWHPLLAATRAIRHPLGLDHGNITAILKRIRVM